MTLSVENTLVAENFLISVGEGFAKAEADGKLDFSDSIDFLEPLMLVPGLIKAAGQVPAELKDLDAVEGLQLIDNAVSKIPQLSEKSVKVLKAVLAIVVDSVALYNAIKG